MVRVSAPGKVHLVGEHAVVYGEPAIIAAVGLRCYVNAEKGDKEIVVRSPQLNIEELFLYEEAMEFSENIRKLWKVCHARNDFIELFNLIKKKPINQIKTAVGEILSRLYIGTGVRLEINSEIPMGTGLGSSAALSVAITKAIAELYRKGIDKEEVNEIAFAVEKYMHGTPSGGDNSASCYGGLIWFQKPNIIESLPIAFGSLRNFILVDSGKPEKSTGELVQQVRNLDNNYRSSRIRAIGHATLSMKDALHQEDFSKMKGLMNFAQRQLKDLGVSTRKIDTIHDEVMKIGGSAKLCGAGGGGVVLCYHEDKAKLIDKIKSLGYEPLEADLAVEGIRVEK